jgi:hypothetical protein
VITLPVLQLNGKIFSSIPAISAHHDISIRLVDIHRWDQYGWEIIFLIQIYNARISEDVNFQRRFWRAGTHNQ